MRPRRRLPSTRSAACWTWDAQATSPKLRPRRLTPDPGRVGAPASLIHAPRPRPRRRPLHPHRNRQAERPRPGSLPRPRQRPARPRCARRDDDSRFGMALGDAGVSAILVVGAVAGERRHGSCNLVEQGAGLRRVVHILGVRVEATIRPVPASTPGYSTRRDRRVAVPCFSSSHLPAPHGFRPVLSTTRCMGSPPTPAPAFRGRGTSSVAARRLKVVWSGTRKLRPSRPTTEPIRPLAYR